MKEEDNLKSTDEFIIQIEAFREQMNRMVDEAGKDDRKKK